MAKRPTKTQLRFREIEKQLRLSRGTVSSLEASSALTSLTRTTRDVSSSVTLLASDSVILADASGGAITLTLPNVSSATDLQLDIKKVDSSANAVTIDGFSTQTIDGATTQALNTQYDSLTVICDGTEWWII